MNSKADVSDKFSPRRHIVWPSELFIELRLSRKQIEKVRRWEKQGHSFFPMWFCSLERVLFVDQEAFDEWTQKKREIGTENGKRKTGKRVRGPKPSCDSCDNGKKTIVSRGFRSDGKVSDVGGKP